MLVHASAARRRVLACGVRWGKSTCAAMEAVAALMEPREKALGWIVAPTYGLTKAIFERVRIVVLQRLSHRVVEDAEGDYRLTVTNLAGGQSVLQAKSADNSASLLGEAIDFVIVDEAARLKRMIWEQCISQRLIDRKGWALMISTPVGTNWFFTEYRRGQKGLDVDFESWRFPSVTNPHIDAELIEAERFRLSKSAYETEYEAKFAGEDLVERCEKCGGPSPHAVSVLIVNNAREPDRCGACDRPVHADGTTAATLMPNGEVYTKCIYLHDEPPHEPELPATDAPIAVPLAVQHRKLN
jgi:hypothetical protein